MSASTTFPRFLDFPKEVQIIIWQKAGDTDSETAPADVLGGVRRVRYNIEDPISFSYAAFMHKTALHPRMALMQTSHLARLISLEEWQRELQAMVVVEIGWWRKVWMEWTKIQIVRVLGEEIQKMREIEEVEEEDDDSFHTAIEG